MSTEKNVIQPKKKKFSYFKLDDIFNIESTSDISTPFFSDPLNISSILCATTSQTSNKYNDSINSKPLASLFYRNQTTYTKGFQSLPNEDVNFTEEKLLNKEKKCHWSNQLNGSSKFLILFPSKAKKIEQDNINNTIYPSNNNDFKIAISTNYLPNVNKKNKSIEKRKKFWFHKSKKIDSNIISYPIGNPEVCSSLTENLLKNESYFECPLCLNNFNLNTSPYAIKKLLNCEHGFCRDCLYRYFEIEINEGRINLACPRCIEKVHPSDITEIFLNKLPIPDATLTKDINEELQEPSTSEVKVPHEIINISNDIGPGADLIRKYETFTLRRFLVSEPDARWCPAPDCGFAVIATGCASCPMLKCERPNCNTYFCYHCKNEWHPNLTCDTAKAFRFQKCLERQRQYLIDCNLNSNSFNDASAASAAATSLANIPSTSATLASSYTSARSSFALFGRPTNSPVLDCLNYGNETNIKLCPRCQAYIMKMDDGSCNHMTCAICGSEFCWLCMKEISDLHYLSPSGCTFWGKKPWSRKKKILWQLGTLVGAPVGIALIASIAIPAIIIGIPIFVGRKIFTKYKKVKPLNRNSLIAVGVLTSTLFSPMLAFVAVTVGVPILLAYVYGVVPFSLCRNGICIGTNPNTSTTSNNDLASSSTTPNNLQFTTCMKDDSIGDNTNTVLLNTNNHPDINSQSSVKDNNNVCSIVNNSNKPDQTIKLYSSLNTTLSSTHFLSKSNDIMENKVDMNKLSVNNIKNHNLEMDHNNEVDGEGGNGMEYKINTNTINPLNLNDSLTGLPIVDDVGEEERVHRRNVIRTRYNDTLVQSLGCVPGSGDCNNANNRNLQNLVMEYDELGIDGDGESLNTPTTTNIIFGCFNNSCSSRRRRRRRRSRIIRQIDEEAQQDERSHRRHSHPEAAHHCRGTSFYNSFNRFFNRLRFRRQHVNPNDILIQQTQLPLQITNEFHAIDTLSNPPPPPSLIQSSPPPPPPPPPPNFNNNNCNNDVSASLFPQPPEGSTLFNLKKRCKSNIIIIDQDCVVPLKPGKSESLKELRLLESRLKRYSKSYDAQIFMKKCESINNLFPQIDESVWSKLAPPCNNNEEDAYKNVKSDLLFLVNENVWGDSSHSRVIPQIMDPTLIVINSSSPPLNSSCKYYNNYYIPPPSTTTIPDISSLHINSPLPLDTLPESPPRPYSVTFSDKDSICQSIVETTHDVDVPIIAQLPFNVKPIKMEIQDKDNIFGSNQYNTPISNSNNNNTQQQSKATMTTHKNASTTTSTSNNALTNWINRIMNTYAPFLNGSAATSNNNHQIFKCNSPNHVYPLNSTLPDTIQNGIQPVRRANNKILDTFKLNKRNQCITSSKRRLLPSKKENYVTCEINEEEKLQFKTDVKVGESADRINMESVVCDRITNKSPSSFDFIDDSIDGKSKAEDNACNKSFIGLVGNPSIASTSTCPSFRKITPSSNFNRNGCQTSKVTRFVDDNNIQTSCGETGCMDDDIGTEPSIISIGTCSEMMLGGGSSNVNHMLLTQPYLSSCGIELLSRGNSSNCLRTVSPPPPPLDNEDIIVEGHQEGEICHISTTTTNSTHSNHINNNESQLLLLHHQKQYYSPSDIVDDNLTSPHKTTKTTPTTTHGGALYITTTTSTLLYSKNNGEERRNIMSNGYLDNDHSIHIQDPSNVAAVVRDHNSNSKRNHPPRKQSSYETQDDCISSRSFGKSSSLLITTLNDDDVTTSSTRALAGSIAHNRELDEASVKALAGSIIDGTPCNDKRISDTFSKHSNLNKNDPENTLILKGRQR